MGEKHNKNNTMANHNDLGTYGETLALDYLKTKGYKILETNWKYSRAEVDIIAWDGEVLVFIEVKTRSYDTVAKPEDAINKKKITLLSQAAAVYMEQINHDWEIRFDVISILNRKNKQPTLKHFEDAFFPGLH